MFLASKLFAFFFLSPLLFVLLGIVGLANYKHPRRVAGLLATLTILLYVFSIAPTARFFLGPLESRYVASPQAIAHGDVYIVLGGGILERNTPVPYENLTPSSLKRCLAVTYWYKQHPRPIIVCGGAPLRSGISEAAYMARALRELGIPVRAIYQESYSRNTFENILNAKKIVQKQHWRRPLLLTSAFHLPRSMHEARRAGLQPIPIGCDYSFSGQKLSWADFVPEIKYTANVFTALKEYIGIFYYHFRY